MNTIERIHKVKEGVLEILRGGKNFIQEAIKRPGALRRRLGKKPGEKVTVEEARAIMNDPKASPLAKRQAAFFVNVLSKVNRKRKKGK